MRILCVDDESLILGLTVSMCEELDEVDSCVGCGTAKEALKIQSESPADIVLLDINMPDMTGMELAESIRSISPSAKIIFLTGHDEYALDAFKLHASGYLLKPVSRERLANEISYCIKLDTAVRSRVEVNTFGEFEVLSHGNRVMFERSRSKELFAYLIDRRGNGVPRAHVFSVLWEEGVYNRSMQKQLDVIIRSMRATLEKYDIADIFELNKGWLRIIPDKIDCDLYRFLDGDEDTINSFFGEYMNSYTWARNTEAYIDHLYRNREKAGFTPPMTIY